MRDLHESWKRALDAVDAVQAALGATITDAETGKRLDAGQAVCRELYGPDWLYSQEFQAMNAAEVCPPEFFQAAERLCRREPEWLNEKK